MSPSQRGYGGWENASCRTYVISHGGFSFKLLHRHRAGGYHYTPSLRASPLLAMLLSPEEFPLQSKALCPGRYLLPTSPCFAGIRLAVRRRTITFPPYFFFSHRLPPKTVKRRPDIGYGSQNAHGPTKRKPLLMFGRANFNLLGQEVFHRA
jgi:hypothetical protein